MMLRKVPSILTICNFSCGMLSILSSINQRVGLAIFFICLGSLFDLFDGRIARILNEISIFGKELDSLADIVTFGVAPSIVVYHKLSTQLGIVALLIFSICGLIRLARFNAEQSDLTTFIGMPIPLAAILLIASSLVLKPVLLGIVTCLLGFLMISKIKFPSFKKSKHQLELENGEH